MDVCLKSSKRRPSIAETLCCFSPIVLGYVGSFAFFRFCFLIIRSYYFSSPPPSLEFTAQLDDFSFSSLRHVFARVIYRDRNTANWGETRENDYYFGNLFASVIFTNSPPLKKPRVFSISNERIYARFRLIGPSALAGLGDTRAPKKG